MGESHGAAHGLMQSKLFSMKAELELRMRASPGATQSRGGDAASLAQSRGGDAASLASPEPEETVPAAGGAQRRRTEAAAPVQDGAGRALGVSSAEDEAAQEQAGGRLQARAPRLVCAGVTE